jgi:hypothetical protein
MKGKILLIAVIVVAASVLVVLSFIYPEKTTEMSISGTLSREKAERHDLGRLNYNSEVWVSVDVDGYCEGGIDVEVINLRNNRSVAGLYNFSWHAEGEFAPLFFGGHYALEIEAEGDGDYPLSYNSTISITQHGLW